MISGIVLAIGIGLLGIALSTGIPSRERTWLLGGGIVLGSILVILENTLFDTPMPLFSLLAFIAAISGTVLFYLFGRYIKRAY